MKPTINAHPKTLPIFFGTEMWERYGFYVVQTLLALFLAQHFHWADRRVYALVGSFTALTYLSPIIGGWIADRLLGQKNSVLLGAFALLLSYCFLSVLSSDTALTAALAGIAVGTGLLKPNISSLLGNEYPPDSSRRESGFTIFYMGITTGIILGTTLPSQINLYFGWSASFLSAALGMIFSALVFSYGIWRYQIKDYIEHRFSLKNAVSAILLITVIWLVAFYILTYPRLADMAFSLVVVLATCYLLLSIYQESYEQSRKTAIIGLLCLISVVFWSFYFQMFLSLTLFISRSVNQSLLGLDFTPPYYVSVQSLGMLVFGYIFSRKRLKLSVVERGRNIAKKFIYSLLWMFAAYLLITVVSNYNQGNGLISPWLILPAYLMISIAELLLSPVGLAAITILASHSKVSTMMGIYFISLGLGGYVAGKLAMITAIAPDEANLKIIQSTYGSGFMNLQLILLFSIIVCCGLYWLIRRLLNRLDNHGK